MSDFFYLLFFCEQANEGKNTMMIRVMLNDGIIFIKLLLLIFSGTLKMKHFCTIFI